MGSLASLNRDSIPLVCSYPHKVLKNSYSSRPGPKGVAGVMAMSMRYNGGRSHAVQGSSADDGAVNRGSNAQWEEARLEALMHAEVAVGAGIAAEVVGSNNSLEAMDEGYVAEGETSDSSRVGADSEASLYTRELVRPAQLHEISGGLVVLD